MEAVYETDAGGRPWLHVIALSAAASLIAAVALAIAGAESALIIAVVIVALSFAPIVLILPQRYRIERDALVLDFPLWRWRIPLASIESCRAAKAYEPYAFYGVRFAMRPSRAVTLIRHDASLFRRPNLVISPRDRDEFIFRLRATKERALHGGD